MTEQDKARADKFLDRIEKAVGELPRRDGANAVVIAEILQSVFGLRSLLGVVEPH